MFRSSVFVTFLALCASGLGFIVQLLLASHFGVGNEVDVYLFSLSAPTFIAGMISAMLSYTVVPRLVARENDPVYQRRFMGSLMLSVGALSFAVAGIGGGFLSQFQVYLLPLDSPIRVYPDIQVLILLAWMIGACQILYGCLAAILNSRRRYLVASTLGLFPYFGMILLIIGNDAKAIIFVPLGMLLGTSAAVIVGVYLLRRQLFPLPWKNLLWTEIWRLARSSPYTVVAMSCFSSYAVVDAFWGPLAGEGTLASLGYGQRLVIALGNLAVAGPSAVLVPRFAELVRDRNYNEFRRVLLHSLVAVGGIATTLAVLLVLFAENLVQLLFSRGAFGPQEVARVANTLRNMTPGMVAMLMSVVAMRALFCIEGAAKSAARIGMMWTGLYFAASFFLYKNGAPGLALGYSVTWILFISIVTFVLLNIIGKLHA